ncbi:hypothetical protein RhiirB3_532362 [Rhizophagus irregularis]|nr:hypothetical protein RhiirB3_532362 [Rhizophagus irregularis]
MFLNGQCIPFIKFYNLTSREFLNKVYPYRKIIPKDLLDKLFRYFLDHEHKPNNKPEQKVAKEISSKAIDSRFLDHEHKYNKPEQKVTKEISSKPIDSRIITFQHVEIISKWIDKLDITDNIKNSYEFKLILRGSRDGFLPRKFHEICDNQSHTISIIKVQGSNEILGGYNPNIWVSNWCHIAEKDSFIFSFKNKNSIENYILSRVKDEQYAIFNNPNHGPSFGSGLVLFGNDFFNMSYCKNMKKYPNYEKSIRETEKTFSVEEYEIFQITKN